MALGIEIAPEKLADFCRAHHLKRLAFFGSVLRRDFRPDSDVDVLIEFQPGREVGFFRLMAMQQELTALVGREVDLRTPEDLSRLFRDTVVAGAEVQYAE
jgi:uncharacterized protein